MNNISTGQHSFIGDGRDNTASGSHAVIGGGRFNFAGDHSAVGGGSTNHGESKSAIGGGRLNTAENYSAVGGGFENEASSHSAIGGGIRNTAAVTSAIGGGQSNSANGWWSTISGGYSNSASGYGATVGGGYQNWTNGLATTVAGGYFNSANGDWTTVGGGQFNAASGTKAAVGGGSGNFAAGPSATVPGGAFNRAQGSYSFAAGRRAKADHQGSFVWGDSIDADKTSSAIDQFNVYAEGGLRVFAVGSATPSMMVTPTGSVGIGTNAPGFLLEVNGSAGKPGGGAWSVSSDARLKKNVRTLEGALAKLLALRGVAFEYEDPAAIHELSGERVGFLAQEVEPVIPDWVEEDADGMKRLSIRGFEALAVEALRELQGENRALAERVAAQEAELESLRERLERLETR